jgi:hypothetical protein
VTTFRPNGLALKMRERVARESSPAASRVCGIRGDAVRERVGKRARDLRERSQTARLVFETYERDRRQAGALLAGGLAYRLFLWLLPTALVIVSILGLITRVSGTPADRVAGSAGFGAALAATVATAVERTSRSAIYLMLLGTVFSVWAAIGVVKGVRLAATPSGPSQRNDPAMRTPRRSGRSKPRVKLESHFHRSRGSAAERGSVRPRRRAPTS